MNTQGTGRNKRTKQPSRARTRAAQDHTSLKNHSKAASEEETPRNKKHTNNKRERVGRYRGGTGTVLRGGYPLSFFLAFDDGKKILLGIGENNRIGSD